MSGENDLPLKVNVLFKAEMAVFSTISIGKLANSSLAPAVNSSLSFTLMLS